MTRPLIVIVQVLVIYTGGTLRPTREVNIISRHFTEVTRRSDIISVLDLRPFREPFIKKRLFVVVVVEMDEMLVLVCKSSL